MMHEQMSNEKVNCNRGFTSYGPKLRPVDVSDVNDDPAQILDVLTYSERDCELCGADIDVASFVYDEPTVAIVNADVFDRLLADAGMDYLTKKERDRHEHH